MYDNDMKHSYFITTCIGNGTVW